MVIVNLLLKRSASGQLPLLPAATRLLEELPSGLAASTESASTGGLPQEKQLVVGAKKAALLVAGLAYQKYAASLAEQQELLAAMADIIIEVFAMESALLRAEKRAASLGAERAEHAIRMTRLLVHSRLDGVEHNARMALATVSEGNALRTQLAAVGRLLQRDPADTISLRRQIAAHVITQGKYVV